MSPMGTHAPQTGAFAVIPCQPGNHQPAEGQGECLPCQVGEYQPEHGQPSCHKSPKGTYTPNANADRFMSCAKGFHQPLESQSHCVACEVGTHQPKLGAVECVPCQYSMSSALGSEECSVCAAGYYLRAGYVASTSNCLPCPDGALCGWNTTVDKLQVRPGWWRLSDKTPTLYMCAGTTKDEDGEYYNHGNNWTHDHTSGTRACKGGAPGEYSNALCEVGHQGPLCQACIVDYYYFKDDFCAKCPSSTRGFVTALVLFLFVLCLCGTAYWLHDRKEEKYDVLAVPLRQYVHRFKQYQSRVGLVPKCKIFLTFCQVVAALDDTYNIGLPDTWFTWTGFLRFFGEIDWFNWVVPADCIVGNGMSHLLLLTAITPLMVIVTMPFVVAAVAVVKESAARCAEAKDGSTTTVGRTSRSSQANSKDPNARPKTIAQIALAGAFQWLPISLVVAFCFTPSVSAKTFHAWYCVSYEYSLQGGQIEEHSFLAGDLNVRCDGFDEHDSILAVAWVLVTIWPIGMVLLYTALLVPCRFMFLDDDGEDAAAASDSFNSGLLHATAFLHRDYKAAYYWWEIASLVQRTTLTGWLLLIDIELQFIRLIAALCISVAFLVGLLACVPFKRKADNAMATGCQLLFVCIFIGGLIVRLYEDIANDSAGSPALAYRFLGLRSSEEAVIIMILVAFAMITLLGLTLFGESYIYILQQRLESKWSVCTLDPPYIRWKSKAIYAAFLSHYKMEAASDARYMHDMLRKMLKVPVFLDSSTLSDLRNLVTDGVHKSDTLVLLATKGVLSRPWCLIELLETHRKGIPVIAVKMANMGFDFSEARSFALDLESAMAKLNPSGLQQLYQNVGQDLSELRDALLAALDTNERASSSALQFDPHAGDSVMVATMKDVIERMADSSHRTIEWFGSDGKKLVDAQANAPRTSKKLHKGGSAKDRCNSAGRRMSIDMKTPRECAVYVICSPADAVNHARVLRSELEITLGRGCAVGGDADSANLIPICEIVVVLLTKKLPTQPEALLEIWKALDAGRAVVTVAVTGGGYDFAEATKTYSNLSSALNAARPNGAAEMEKHLCTGLTVDAVGARLDADLTSIIAMAWSPHASKNQTLAVVNDICSRLIRAKLQIAMKRTMSMERERKKSVMLNIAAAGAAPRRTEKDRTEKDAESNGSGGGGVETKSCRV